MTALPLSGDNELARGQVARRLPCQDPARARTWYADKLGLHPVEERPGGLRYRCGDTMFALFASAGAPSGQHTQMGWKVADLDAAVAEMRARGVVFEEYDVPGLRTVVGIAEIDGNDSSDGSGGGPPGSTTARATSSGWARRSPDQGLRPQGVAAGTPPAHQGGPTRTLGVTPISSCGQFSYPARNRG